MSVPRLRFKEFGGAWEEKRLGAFFEEFKEKSTEQDQFEVLTSARTGLVRQKDYYDNDRITDRDNVGFNVIPPKYLTYRSRSDDRRFFFNENNLGITGVISVYYPVFRIVNGDNNFFTELLSRYTNHLGKFSVGTSQTVLSMNELKRIKLPIPKSDEQKKIAAFLGVVDAKIAALRARVLGLQGYKRGLMQALFSQTLRFTQKDGTAFPDWEEKRLGRFMELISGLTYSPDDIREAGLLVLRSSNVQNACIALEDLVFVNLNVEEEKLTRAGDILLCVRNGSQRLIGKSALVSEGLPRATHGAFMSVLRGPNNAFLFQLMQTDLFFREVHKNLGATINSINGSDLKKFKFRVPTHPDEQAKIAEALSAMDAKIAAVQDQVSKMQDFKKGLLQQMFV